MTKTQKLQAALAWALKNGIRAYESCGRLEFRDRGCGCCSGEEECPKEFRDVVAEVMGAAEGKSE